MRSSRRWYGDSCEVEKSSTMMEVESELDATKQLWRSGTQKVPRTLSYSNHISLAHCTIVERIDIHMFDANIL